MSSVNMVVLSGRLGAPPEEKRSAAGKLVCTFRMATSRWDSRAEAEATDWHTIVCFDKQAEICAKYLAKGAQVLVEGRLVVRQWEGTDGKKQARSEVVANRVTFLGQPTRAGTSSQPTEEMRPPVIDFAEAVPF